MGIGLEGVTNLGSSTKEIVDQSQKVSQMLPTVKTLTTELLGAAPKKSNELIKAVEESTNAGEAITKSLIAINAKVDDANRDTITWTNFSCKSARMGPSFGQPSGWGDSEASRASQPSPC